MNASPPPSPPPPDDGNSASSSKHHQRQKSALQHALHSDNLSQVILTPSYLTRKFRADTWERWPVAIALLAVAMVAILTLTNGIAFALGKHSRDTSTLLVLLNNSNVTAATAVASNVDTNDTKLDTLVEISPAGCRVHVTLLPSVFITFVALGSLYLVSGGWPWTACARFRSGVCGCLRKTVGFFMILSCAALADVLAYQTFCTHKASTAPRARQFALLMSAAAYVIVYAGLYAHFATNESAQKRKILWHSK